MRSFQGEKPGAFIAESLQDCPHGAEILFLSSERGGGNTRRVDKGEKIQSPQQPSKPSDRNSYVSEFQLSCHK